MKKVNHKLIKKHGGAREGSGRPVGSGKYKSPTKTVRIPVKFQNEISKFIESKCYNLPIFSGSVQAGSPSHVGEENYPDTISIHNFLVEHPEDTFLIRANGESMINAGIFSGDLLIVDRKAQPKDGSIVIASVNGEFTVKRLSFKNGKSFLLPENPMFKPININEHDDVVVFGVVRHSIHQIF
jgi:DNA polymerase V